MTPPDTVNNPAHYTAHPSGVECLEITRYLPFDVGNAVKYVWRAGIKSADATEDLLKAEFYLQDYLDHDLSGTLPMVAIDRLTRVIVAETKANGASHPRTLFYRDVRLGNVRRALEQVRHLVDMEIPR